MARVLSLVERQLKNLCYLDLLEVCEPALCLMEMFIARRTLLQPKDFFYLQAVFSVMAARTPNDDLKKLLLDHLTTLLEFQEGKVDAEHNRTDRSE